LRVIAVINQKGGVGKTTTACNLGAALAMRGKRVLLIDFDPQSNLTSHLEASGIDPDHSAYDLLRGSAGLDVTARPTNVAGLFLVPSGGDLAAAEVELVSEIGRETLLRDRLRNATVAPFDYVFIDCAPSLGLLAVNALTAADEVLVPIQAEFFALQGMARYVQVHEQVRQRLNPGLELGGIVICMWKGQANLSREVRDDVKRAFGGVLYETLIRQNVKLAEAPSAGKTIFEHDPTSNGALDYAELAIEFLVRHGESDLATADENGQKVEAETADLEADPRSSGDPAGTTTSPAASLQEGPALGGHEN
jgi:chromosome partitioning protein